MSILDTIKAIAEKADDALDVVEDLGFIENNSFTPTEGDYENIRCHSIVLSNGRKVLPNAYGYYSNPTGDEELQGALDFYEGFGLLRKV